MRHLILIVATTLAVTSAPPSLGAADHGGFMPLFNGKDLSGWTMGPDRSWVVEDGVITLKRTHYDGKEHNADYLWAIEPMENFVVELEFKVPANANSGIYLRTADRNDPVPTGLEVQVANSFGQTNLSRTGTAGAIYDCLAPTANPIRPPGEWNHYRITCIGPQIEVILNGVQVINMNLDQWSQPNRNPDGSPNKFNTALKDFARKGYFGFQDHGRPVWYRNVRVKRLNP